MSSAGNDFAVVTQHIRKLRGGSQSILVQASDGLQYVVKFNNNLQGAGLPFNESVGSELYRACKLPVPGWKPLWVTDSFLDDNLDCWMETDAGPLRPDSGLSFGSRFLGDDETRILEILPNNSFQRIRNRANFWLARLLDICAEHADNRQAIFAEDTEGWLDAFFVDHGHLFGGPKGEQQPHFRASSYLDLRIYEGVPFEHILDYLCVFSSLDVDRLWKQVDSLPVDWKSASAANGLARCLDRLSSTSLLHNILDTIIDDHEQRNKRKTSAAAESILRLGVQTATMEQFSTGF